MLGNTTLRFNESLKLSYNLYDDITHKTILDDFKRSKIIENFNIQTIEYTSNILIECFCYLS